MKLRQTLLSLGAFALVLGALIYVDPRVRDRFEAMVSGGDGISSWNSRAIDLANTLVEAIRHQSIENGPLMIFAVVGVVLFLFMVRT